MNLMLGVREDATSPNDATGVGNKKDPVSLVWGTKGGRRKALPFRVVPDRGQGSENNIHPPNKQS